MKILHNPRCSKSRQTLALIEQAGIDPDVVLYLETPPTAAELDEILGPGGGLSQRFDGYEDRPGQRDMLRTVVECFNDGGVAIIEAGTGTGKSLAYLLPAARWAQENGERTVVSTNTINLQEQLLPVLELEAERGDNFRCAR